MEQNELMHYGVLGMKWGVHRGNVSTAYGKAKRHIDDAKKDIKKGAKKVSSISKKTINKGKKKVAKFLREAADKFE